MFEVIDENDLEIAMVVLRGEHIFKKMKKSGVLASVDIVGWEMQERMAAEILTPLKETKQFKNSAANQKPKQISKNRCDATEPRILGDHLSKSILDTLKASQIWNGCASQERVAIKSGANYCCSFGFGSLSSERSPNVMQRTNMDISNLHVSDNCLSKDIVKSRKCKLLLSNETITKELCNWIELISVVQCQMPPRLRFISDLWHVINALLTYLLTYDATESLATHSSRLQPSIICMPQLQPWFSAVLVTKFMTLKSLMKAQVSLETPIEAHDLAYYLHLEPA